MTGSTPSAEHGEHRDRNPARPGRAPARALAPGRGAEHVGAAESPPDRRAPRRALAWRIGSAVSRSWRTSGSQLDQFKQSEWVDLAARSPASTAPNAGDDVVVDASYLHSVVQTP